MNDLLDRWSYNARHVERRRLVLGATLLLVTSACWYVLRPTLMWWAALSSIGAPYRADLLGAAIRQADPNLSHIESLGTHTLPRPGWLAFDSLRTVADPPDESAYHTEWVRSVADHRLRIRGSIALPYPMQAPPGDMDGDGRWEVVVRYEAIPVEDERRRVDGWAVVRLGKTSNEIVWAGLTDANLWSGRSAKVRPIWRDEDGDGVKELVFVTVVMYTMANGRIGFRPPTTVAVFEWDSPGGTLRPRLVPPGSGVLAWTPPQGGSVPVAQTAELGPVLAELCPVPEGFGVPAASRPATATTTAPAPPCIKRS